jgi:hypothetical protein
MDNVAIDLERNERNESLPWVGSGEQQAAGGKPPGKNPAEGMPGEQLEEAEQDAEDPTHEKEVPAENKK